MVNTDVKGIVAKEKGILLNTSPDTYQEKRQAAIDAQRNAKRIDSMESELKYIKQLLQTILDKVG